MDARTTIPGACGRRRAAAALALVCLLAGAARADEAADLKRQVGYLAEALADARAVNDSLRARLARQAFGDGVVLSDAADTAAVALAAGVRVADVNRDLRMVILDAGRLQGMAPGVVLSVVQGDRAIARIRVVDVRRALSGAVIEDVVWRAFPAPGDRVLAAAAAE